jgi:DNA helicase HerA-like ATPase
MSQIYGSTTVPSSARRVSFIAAKPREGRTITSIVGKLIYFDTVVDDETFRSIGTVTDMKTLNTSMNASMEGITAEFNEGGGGSYISPDLRKSEIMIQAVFKYTDEGWVQYNSTLPTSPPTNLPVHLVTEETVREMLLNASYPAVGYFRGLRSPLPFNIPNFDRSATHAAVLGKSGSGKTQFYGMMLGGYMRHENHAIMVIDPQGQWGNENGMIFSPQNFARNLGRKVDVVRVAEDIQLPMDAEAITAMLEKLQVWRRFRRMGTEQIEAFSREVAERFANRFEAVNRGDSTRMILERIFSDIANSPSSLSRIYVPGERQDRFRDELKLLVGEEIIETGGPRDGEMRVITAEEEADAEAIWENVLYAFQPLHSLFAPTNLSGGKRRPLGGNNGFLTQVFQVRDENSAPAPYVVLDMSPNVALHAASDLARNDAERGMQAILDNQDIKALILILVMDEMKRASEIAFASGHGLLNTQIVFDEAWRYAPEGRATPEIERLASMLEGFALDTRKFGIGWTYILQSPSDLKRGIWRQLTYVYAGYGLVGEDVRALEGLSDDPSQIDLYRQFISPFSTKQYPFMVMGPISPLIFTTAPTFLNAFNGNDEFLQYNSQWIQQITNRRSLPAVTVQSLAQSVLKPVAKAVKKGDEGHPVGKTYTTSEPQVAPKKPRDIPESRLRDEIERPILDTNIGNDPEPLDEFPY